jgi:hypothetical protein
MHRRLSWPLAHASLGLLLLLACSGSHPQLFPDVDGGLRGGKGGGGGSGRGRAGSGGGSGSGGAGGSAGSAGSAGSESLDGGLGDSGPDGGSVDAGPCRVDADCDDGNLCTVDHCAAGVCSASFEPSGTVCSGVIDSQCAEASTCNGTGTCVPHPAPIDTVCGEASTTDCSQPDSCDGAGFCRPNDALLGASCGDTATTECSFPDVCDGRGGCSPSNAEANTPCGDTNDTECSRADTCDGQGLCVVNDRPNGTACTGGSCTGGQCIQGQPVGCPADLANTVPFNINWSSVNRPDLYHGDCDAAGTPDYALVFTAPQAGTHTYRFHAIGATDSTPDAVPPDGDSVMTLAQGSCSGPNGAPVQNIVGGHPESCNDDKNGGTFDSELDVTMAQGDVITVYLNEFQEPGGGTGSLSIVLVP